MRKFYESPEIEIAKYKINALFTDSSDPSTGGVGDADVTEPNPLDGDPEPQSIF